MIDRSPGARNNLRMIVTPGRRAGIGAEVWGVNHLSRQNPGATNMRCHANTLKGNKLAGLNGEIRKVKEFSFDDNTWAVRYLTIAAGTGGQEKGFCLRCNRSNGSADSNRRSSYLFSVRPLRKNLKTPKYPSSPGRTRSSCTSITRAKGTGSRRS